MLIHGWIAYKNEHVSPDTKGDGFYYLGLLFTFVSLVPALIAFARAGDPFSGDMLPLIGNFGIALVTTIFGLGGRVLFTMTLDSPGDVAAHATQTLEAAINEMTESVVRGGRSMEDLVDHLKRSADELQKTTEGIASSVEKADSTAAALADYSAKVVQMANAFSSSVDDFRGAVKRGSDSVAGLEARMAGTDASLRGFGSALEGAAKMLAALENAAGEAKTAVVEARERTVGEMNRMTAQVSALGDEAIGVRDEFTKMTGAFSDGAEAAARSLGTVAESVERADSTAAALAAYSAKIVKMAEAFSVSVDDFRGAVGRGSDSVVRMEERMAGTDKSLRGFGSALEDAAKMLLTVEAAAKEAQAALSGAQDGAVREVGSMVAQVSTLGNEAVGVRDEFKKMTSVIAEGTEAAARSLSAVESSAGSASALEEGLGKTGAAVSKLASNVVEASERMAEATSGLRDVGGHATAASEGLEGMKDAAVLAQSELATVSRAAKGVHDQLAGPGSEAAKRMSAAATQADRVATDLNRLTDQLDETERGLRGIMRQSKTVVDKLAKHAGTLGRSGPFARLFRRRR